MNIWTRLLLFAIGVVFASTAWAADKNIGEREYTFKCAVCHGATGKGDGPYVDSLKIAPTDLTVLRKKNGGQFPFERVFEVVDGRANIKAHGTRDMPIWGNEYTEEAVEYYSEMYDILNAELFVQGRILSLITYLRSIQEG
ncbi:MAG: hypothetical protein AMJ69_07220 [Gammaproteobacteria bacterium SG8_47]|nr:MAG: hypothetical protein AMJ69_07220 [Gammaproteobacteria bacterium SG8_47]